MRNDLQRFLRDRKLYLLDMDGTLYLGKRLFEHSLAFLQAIRASGADYLFLTNNSWLRANYSGRLIYALGTASFRAQLRSAGFPITQRYEEAVDCLLMGYDTELTYQKLIDATRLINRGITYLATNPDWGCPTEEGYLPDCGAIAQALEHATGRLPLFLGKPRPEIAQLAMQIKGVTPAQTVLVGDRIYTDIACGRAAGTGTILVYSGESTPATLEGSDLKPDFALGGIGEILAALP